MMYVYDDRLLPNMKKLENGLFLQKTHFGYMVSGVSKSADPGTIAVYTGTKIV